MKNTLGLKKRWETDCACPQGQIKIQVAQEMSHRATAEVRHGQCLFKRLAEAAKYFELVGTDNLNCPGIC